MTNDIARRMFLFSGAAALAGCAAPDLAPAIRPSGKPDLLASIRFAAEAPPDIWTSHLNVAAMRNAPNVLALSGGGEDGAFGAGALNGWSAAGGRPDFDLVTGISTGALIAPFAFLGSDHDPTLRQIFTQHDAADIMRFRGLSGFLDDALYSTAPLQELLEFYVSNDVVTDVAARHAAGARLFVVTSNLEANRAVVWNMGEIAGLGQADLFRGIMRASSALPGLFPPVNLRLAAADGAYTETHVDGGLHMQMLAVPTAAFDAGPIRRSGGHLYLIINNTLYPAPQAVPRTTVGVSQHALTTMVRSSAVQTVSTAQLFARQGGLDLSVASIDPSSGIVFDTSERFSQTYMRSLFAHGFQRALGSGLITNR
ncbi:patatin-like phospholipase family protein [Roseobacter sinensis]|uniref:Patatin-like phospholipase family protein n=1 Tax=Roseobacter sinensis TaxID=2931391 RepID=A0ABT3BKX9_9RHOB|nr:patatin-like phospholipase family protein [Roseobacter sp. WL0113]MCV3274228.1 patatin-like phospholipase family protein [Roseobacter sp. WL0113]